MASVNLRVLVFDPRQGGRSQFEGVPEFGDVARSILSSFMNASDAAVEFTALLKNAGQTTCRQAAGRGGARFEFLTCIGKFRQVKNAELWRCSS